MLRQYVEAIESSNIVSKTDIDGIITFVNDEFCRISGYRREELIGQNHNIVRHPDVPSSNFHRLWQTILAKKTYKATVKNRAKDGGTFYVNTTIVPILDERGEVQEFVAIRYDVTREMELRIRLQEKERQLEELNRGLEERVRHQTRELQSLNQELEERIRTEVAKNQEKQKILLWQARFASLGQMMANIAHQWRQPLTELGLSLYHLKNALREEKSQEEIDGIYRESRTLIHSMSRTIDDFTDFFKPDRRSGHFPISKSLEDAQALIRRALEREGISLLVQGDPGLTLRGIPNELTQVLLNLFQNSRDAFLLHDRTVKRRIRLRIERDQDTALIRVEDNAGGIGEEVLEQIFEPYFTTKHSRQGTGLGLFMSRMIIQKSFKGSLEVRNRPQGAEFTIRIPLENPNGEEEQNHETE